MTSSPTTDWTGALCAEIPHADRLFYPDGRGALRHLATQRAIQICQDCPLIDQCRETAMAYEGGRHLLTRYGVWGGTTPEWREAEYRRRYAAKRREKRRRVG